LPFASVSVVIPTEARLLRRRGTPPGFSALAFVLHRLVAHPKSLSSRSAARDLLPQPFRVAHPLRFPAKGGVVACAFRFTSVAVGFPSRLGFRCHPDRGAPSAPTRDLSSRLDSRLRPPSRPVAHPKSLSSRSAARDLLPQLFRVPHPLRRSAKDETLASFFRSAVGAAEFSPARKRWVPISKGRRAP
jgi:hypothetical protein